jgi:addiction module RelE/StbE family toxin
MRRQLLCATAFTRGARRLVRRHPQAAQDVQRALEQLAGDAFHPSLRTHKLKGKLTGSWACSAGSDLRIVFSFVDAAGEEAILLETMGTHEEVY